MTKMTTGTALRDIRYLGSQPWASSCSSRAAQVQEEPKEPEEPEEQEEDTMMRDK